MMWFQGIIVIFTRFTTPPFSCTAILCCFAFFHCLLSVSHAETLIKAAPFARHITTVDGINLGQVNRILQDSRGYLWLATHEGLVRFDGVNARRFVHSELEHQSLSHNVINGLAQDSQGKIWISTYGGGLNKYDPLTDELTRIDLSTALFNTGAVDKLYQLTIDNENVLWIGSSQGIIRFDIGTEQRLPLPEALSDLPDDVLLSRLMIDEQGGYWFASYAHGVFWYDGQILRQFNHRQGDVTTLSSNRVRELHQDGNGDIWIATSKGLDKFHRQTQSFSRFIPEQHRTLNQLDNDIFAINHDGRNRLWLGGVINGIFTFDIQSKQFAPVSGNTDINNQFKSNRINHVFKDRNGTLWFATAQGIVMLPKVAQGIDYLTNQKGSFKVYDIKVLSEQRLAVVGNFAYHEVDLQDWQAQSLYPDMLRPYRVNLQPNQLWFATLGGSLLTLNERRNPYDPLSDSQMTQSLPLPTAYFDTFVDSEGKVWGLPLSQPPHYSGGLIRFDPVNNRTEVVATGPVFNDTLQLDKDTWLLASTFAGIFTLNTKTATLSPFVAESNNIPQQVLAMHKDRRGNLWFATEGMGLARLSAGKDEFEYFTTDHGLLSNGIVSIVEDNDGILWLGSALGLMRFNTKDATVNTFEHQDGLLFAKFYKRSGTLLPDGRVLMGTFGGLVIFNPDDMLPGKKPLNTVINRFKRFNQPVAPASKDPDSPLKKSITYTEHLQLSYRDYVFSFGFSALELQRPENIEYAYKMEGLDEQWLYTDARNNVATYTTLAAKDYTFKVKAHRGDGRWSEVTSIKVSIAPPWWLTHWALAGYVLLLIASILAFVRYRTHRWQLHARELEDNVAKRTMELKKSRDESDAKSTAIERLLQQKQRLFASISHEFRTPLTLILSPVEDLLKQQPEQQWLQKLSLVKNNGQRLLRLVEQLLEFAKLEQNARQDKESISIQQTLALIVPSFEQLVVSKSMTLKVNPFEDAHLSVVTDSLNKILLNLLSNAFKYTPEHGVIEIAVDVGPKEIAIAIKDNGIGIDVADQGLIFERFGRAAHRHDTPISGAGLGLPLVKELVAVNGGRLTVESHLNRGSVFTVHLPLCESFETAEAKVQPQSLALEVETANDTFAQPMQQQVSADTSDSELKTLLIIDDNADMRGLLCEQLNPHYHCLSAVDGLAGLAIAQEKLPDLVLSDVMMPQMDGYELTERLKSDPLTCHIPVILLTAKSGIENRLHGLRLLVDDYLTKPFNGEELRQRIANLLTLRENLQQYYAKTLEDKTQPQKIEGSVVNPNDQQFIDRIYQQLEASYADPDFNVEALYQAMNLSERQLQRKLKALIGLSVPELMRQFRLNKALELLLAGHRISNIYYEVGFSSHSYFTRCFKTRYGKTPKAYQQALSD